jgi:hypothetical protein
MHQRRIDELTRRWSNRSARPLRLLCSTAPPSPPPSRAAPATFRQIHGPQVMMTGESAHAQLMAQVRDRLDTAVADSALLPAWLTLVLGHQPVGEDVAESMDSATSLLACRVTYRSTVQPFAVRSAAVPARNSSPDCGAAPRDGQPDPAGPGRAGRCVRRALQGAHVGPHAAMCGAYASAMPVIHTVRPQLIGRRQAAHRSRGKS